MELVQAFRLEGSPSVALVGAGGKTSLLLRLAYEYRQAGRGVLLTTTTHLRAREAASAGAHLTIASEKDLDGLQAGLLKESVVVTGPPEGNEKVGAVGPGILNELARLATAHGAALIIEADGSRGLPLKAPTAHEPAIPEFVSSIVVVAGLSGVGLALGSDSVHRHAEFGRLAGLRPGDRVTAAALARVLIHPRGGLKNIPAAARPVLFLNQADTPERCADGLEIARLAIGDFEAVGIGNVRSPPHGRDASPGDREMFIHSVHENIAGIVLAAGESSRFSSGSKQVMVWRGAPLVRHVALTALGAGLQPVFVVTGANSTEVEAALDGLPVVIVANPGWAGGQSTSLRAGVDRLPGSCGGAVFLLADQPQIPQTLIQALVERHSQTLAPITAPLIAGRRGNPVLFDRVTFERLLGLTGDSGGRMLFSRYPVAWVDWHDEGLLLDVDTPDDLAAFLEKYPDSMS